MLRIFDIVLASIGLIILSPLMLLLLISSLIDTGSPIFKQTRLGRNKSPFTLLKFRTMHIRTSSLATHLVDPSSVTYFGSILRRTKLDELPQLWNVLKGDMSIVGPRPGLPNQIELTKMREKHGVYKVRPGITGLSQIRNIDMSTPKLIAENDSLMISEISAKNYLAFIILTFLGKGRGDPSTKR